MEALIPLLAALAGLVIYALAANPKMAEVGRLLFFAGAFVTLLAWMHVLVRIP